MTCAALALSLVAVEWAVGGEPRALPKEVLERLPPELRYVPEPVPPERNAVPLLREAAEKVTKLDSRLFELLDQAVVAGGEFPTGPDGDLIRKWIDENRAARDLCDRALERSGFQDARDGLTAAARFRFLLLGGAARLAADGKLADAMREAWKLARLAQKTWGGEGFIVHWMAGTTLETLALLILGDLARDPAAPRDGLEWLLRAVASAPDPRAALARTHRRELCAFFLPRLLEAPANGDTAALAAWLGKNATLEEKVDEVVAHAYHAVLEGHPKPFDFDATVALATVVFTTFVRNAVSPWRDRVKVTMPEVEQALAAWPKPLAAGAAGFISREDIEEAGLTGEDALRRGREALAAISNPVGKFAIGTLCSFDKDDSTFSLARRAAELEAERAALRAIAGLRLYAIAKQAEAPSLDALVEEKILTAVPADPFDGKPLRYSCERGHLWSVGPDGAETGEARADERGERKPFVWASRVLDPDGPSPRVREWLALAPAEVRIELRPLVPWRNAYPLLALAAKKLVEFKYDESDQDTVVALADLIQEQSEFPDEEALQAIEAHLKANGDALELAGEAISRPRLRVPPVMPDGEFGKFLVAMRSLVHLKVARARIKARGGDVEACVDELVDTIRLAALHADGETLLLGSLVGQGILHIALTCVRWVANEPGASAHDLARLLEALPARGRVREWLAKGLRVELVYILRGIERYPGGDDVHAIAEALFEGLTGEQAGALRPAFEAMLEGHPAPLDKADTARRLGDRFAAHVRAAGSPWAARERYGERAPEEALSAWPVELRSNLLSVLGDGLFFDEDLPDPIPPEVITRGRASLAGIQNPVGRLIAHASLLTGSGSDSFLSTALDLEAEIEAARAVLGLRLYFKKKAERTPSLDALVEAKVLAAVPLDPFTGKPLGYSRERGVLWSIGPDGDNDGTGPIYSDFGGKESWIWPAPSPAAAERPESKEE